jgi:hypothetical protein
LYGLEVLGVNLALTLILAEVSLRVYAYSSGGSLLFGNTLDAYRLAPGQDYGGGLHGNRLGYPGREFQRDKRPGIYRIAALGDSFAIGPTVPFAENYLTLLEKSLSGCEVYNFGVSSTGPREYHLILKQHVWTFQPDLVLVSVFVGNDITEMLPTPRHLDPRQHCLYLLFARGGRLLREWWRQCPQATDQVVGRIANPSSPDRLTAATLSEVTFREVEARRLAVCLQPAPPGMEKKWQRALAYLDRIVTDCRCRQVPVVFVLIPDEFQVNPQVLADALQAGSVDRNALDLDLPQRRLRDFFAERNVPCLDLRPAFEEIPDTYTPRDTHWNVRGNCLAAQRISEWLRELWANPPVSARLPGAP